MEAALVANRRSVGRLLAAAVLAVGVVAIARARRQPDDTEGSETSTEHTATLPALVVETSTRTDGQRRQRSSARLWGMPLVVAGVSFLVAMALWPEGFTLRKPPDVTGGLLLLADSGEKVTDRIARQPVAASVDAELWETGYPDTSMLALSLTFAKPTPGLRWYVVVSGQYNPAHDTELNAFCTGRPGTRIGAIVRCPNDPIDGSVDIEYRLGDRIGLIYEGTIYRIADMRGYIDDDATVITGRVARAPEYGKIQPTRIFIPIPTPDRARLGSDEYGSLARIGYRGGAGIGWDIDDPLGRLAANQVDSAASLASVSTGHPIEHIRMPSLKLVLNEHLNTRDVEWASPSPDRPDRLTWSTKEGTLGPISFLIHDPFEQNELVLRSFAAGVFVSIAVGTVVLLIEQQLFRAGRFGGARGRRTATARRRQR